MRKRSARAPRAVPGEVESTVVLLGPPSPLGVMVLEIGALVGAPIQACDGVDDVVGTASLMLTLPGAEFPNELPQSLAECPRVSLGDADDVADLAIPQQAHLLAQLLTQFLTQPRVGSARGDDGKSHSSCLIVCGCQGGIGTSTAAANLARVHGSLLLDASGNPPSPQDTDALHWGLIDPLDPPLPTELLAGLSRIAGLRCLRALPGDDVTLSDPRVLAIAQRAAGYAVIDGGVWKPHVDRLMGKLSAAGNPVRLVLASREGEARTLAGILSVVSAVGMPRLVFGSGPELGLVAREWGIPIERLPKPQSARWCTLWQRIWEGR